MILSPSSFSRSNQLSEIPLWRQKRFPSGCRTTHWPLIRKVGLNRRLVTFPSDDLLTQRHYDPATVTIIEGSTAQSRRTGCCRGAVPDCDGRRTEPSKGGMIVRERAVLVAELIPQRDSGLDDLWLGPLGAAFPCRGILRAAIRQHSTSLSPLPRGRGEEILIERQIDSALAGNRRCS